MSETITTKRAPKKAKSEKNMFDTNFTRFVSTKVVSVLYQLALAAIILTTGIAMVVGIVQSASGDGSAALITIGAAITGLVLSLVVRLVAEMTIVVFRIAENTKILASATLA